ncbi:Uncharacterised protein [Streptomyces griseus]|nr:hypothetical protein SAMN04490359_2252 [Streptomyces griseus]SQA26683.1 Uncharacterised protein [Streptomyces griseus]
MGAVGEAPAPSFRRVAAGAYRPTDKTVFMTVVPVQGSPRCRAHTAQERIGVGPFRQRGVDDAGEVARVRASSCGRARSAQRGEPRCAGGAMLPDIHFDPTAAAQACLASQLPFKLLRTVQQSRVGCGHHPLSAGPGEQVQRIRSGDDVVTAAFREPFPRQSAAESFRVRFAEITPAGTLAGTAPLGLFHVCGLVHPGGDARAPRCSGRRSGAGCDQVFQIDVEAGQLVGRSLDLTEVQPPALLVLVAAYSCVTDHHMVTALERIPRQIEIRGHAHQTVGGSLRQDPACLLWRDQHEGPVVVTASARTGTATGGSIVRKCKDTMSLLNLMESMETLWNGGVMSGGGLRARATS